MAIQIAGSFFGINRQLIEAVTRSSPTCLFGRFEETGPYRDVSIAWMTKDECGDGQGLDQVFWPLRK
jgi:hypothetical protein